MLLIPAFEIGLWNTWMLTIYLPLHPLIMMLIVKDARKKMMGASYSKADNVIFVIKNLVLFFGLFIYAIFLPLKLGTLWFYTGLALCAVGWITWTVAMVNISHIPPGEAWTRGFYRYSRHPMVLASFFIFIGAGIASASWLFLLLSVVMIILSNISVTTEERLCLERFGTAYREYMNRTPKWIGMPTSEKHLTARKKDKG
jgi:protein-S-isoprenylcysteine O-methyltransferase Ste14